MNEDILKAYDSVNFLLEELRAAYQKADPMAELVMGPLIDDTVKLRHSVSELKKAIERGE